MRYTIEFESAEFINRIVDKVVLALTPIINNQNQQPTVEKLLTRKETMEFLGISSTSLYNYQRSGQLLPHKVGRRTYFLLSEINSSIKNN